MKTRWSSLSFGSVALHFQIKLSTHDSILNCIFVIMSEIFFLSTLSFSKFNHMMHVGALKKLRMNEPVFEQNFTTSSYGVKIGSA
jgi:hypothetical protein